MRAYKQPKIQNSTVHIKKTSYKEIHTQQARSLLSPPPPLFPPKNRWHQILIIPRHHASTWRQLTPKKKRTTKHSEKKIPSRKTGACTAGEPKNSAQKSPLQGRGKQDKKTNTRNQGRKKTLKYRKASLKSTEQEQRKKNRTKKLTSAPQMDEGYQKKKNWQYSAHVGGKKTEALKIPEGNR